MSDNGTQLSMRGSGSIRAGIVTAKGTYVSQNKLKDMGYKIVLGAVNELARLDRTKSLDGDRSINNTARIPDETTLSFASANVLEPPSGLEFEILLELAEKNVTHGTACETKAADFAYNGWELRLADGAADLNIDKTTLAKSRREVELFLNTSVGPYRSVPDLIFDVACDHEVLGTCGFEILRDMRGLVAELNYIPFHTVRALKWVTTTDKDKAHYVQSRFNQNRYFVKFGEPVTYTRGFNPLTASIEAFPDYNARKSFIKLNGLYVHRDYEDEMTSDIMKAATELFVIARGACRRSSVYGTPAGRSAHVSMLGEMRAEQYNLDFFTSKGVPQYAVIFEGVGTQSFPSTGETEWDESEAAMAVVEEFFATRLQASDRAVLVLQTAQGTKVTFQRLSPETVSEVMIAYGKNCRESTRLSHRTPPAALGIVETANLGSGREVSQLMRYRDHIVSPGQRKFAAVVNMIIRTGLLIPYWEFRFLPMPVDDESSRREHKLNEFEKGAITPNEYRMETGRPSFTGETTEDDAGDALYLRNAQVTIVDKSGKFRTTMPGTGASEAGSLDQPPNPKTPEAASSEEQP